MVKPLPSKGWALARGFTLAEAMIVVALIGILAALAAPSFADLIATTRVKAASSDLHASFLLARSESIKRNARVSVIAEADGWPAGWTVQSADDFVIQTSDLHDAVVVATAVASVIFEADGRVVGGGRPTFQFTAVSEKGRTRCLEVGPSGRPYVLEGECPG